MAQPVVPHRAVVAFNIGVLLRIAGLDIIKPDDLAAPPSFSSVPLMYSGPLSLRMASWFAAPFDDLIQRPHDPLCRQRKINFDRQRFPVEVIDHVEQTDSCRPSASWSCMKSIDQH